MLKTISILIYLGLISLGSSENLMELDYKNVNASTMADVLNRYINNISDTEKETISQKVLSTKRVDLTLLLFSNYEIQSVLAKQIRELPEDEFKGKVIVEALKSKDLWLEKQKVNKGGQIRMMVSVCDGTLHHHFPNDPVSWLEYSDMNSRIRLADDLAKSLKGEKVVKRNKDLNLSLPSHQPSTESDLSFEEGWGKIETNANDNRPQNYLKDSILKDQRGQDNSQDLKIGNGDQSDISRKMKSNFLRIIMGVLLVVIFAVALKICNDKSKS